jgi:phosphoglycerate dehydrogenase-like enzyme
VPIAEWVIAMLVNLARDLRQMIRNQDSTTWDRSAVFQREIRGLTLGLWGYGGIGRETARLAKHMGLRVHVMSRRGVGPRRDFYCVPAPAIPRACCRIGCSRRARRRNFSRSSTFLVVALPLTKATEGLIGERDCRRCRVRRLS